MSEEKKRPEESKANSSRKKKFSLGKIFYHNTFVLIFSFVVAVVSWFLMSANSSDRGVIIEDVPIEVRYSSAAEEAGLKVFNKSSDTVDLQVTGNTLITSQLTANDFDVAVTLNPTSTTLAGNTMQKLTAEVQAVKANSLANFEITQVNPEEVTLEYDRYQETNFKIESNIQYSSGSGYYASTPILSSDNVTISGPESSVNRISKVAVEYKVESPLKQEAQFSCPLVLYDKGNQEITNISDLCLTMNVDTVDVTIPVSPVKTGSLVASTLHQPEGFVQDRIQIEPAEITIAGSTEVLSGISEIQLDKAIDFAQLKAGTTNTFTMDIPLPSGVRNISAVGDTPSQATVSINLNGYEEVPVTVASTNIQIINPPSGMKVDLATSILPVTVMGPEAQVTKLTGDSVAVQVDLSNFQNQTGTVNVPATVTLTSGTGDSCWVTGEYTVSVTISASQAVAMARINPDEKEKDGLAAMPQE